MSPSGPHRINGTGTLPSNQRGGPNPYQIFAGSLNNIYKIIGRRQSLSETALRNERTFSAAMGTMDELLMVLQGFLYGTDDVSCASRQTSTLLFSKRENRTMIEALNDREKGPKLLKAFKEAMLAMLSLGFVKQWPFNTVYTNSIAKLSMEHPQHVLEIGAGIEGLGFISHEKYLRQHKILLLDKNPFVCDLLSAAVRQEQSSHIEVTQADILDFNPGKRQFDVIFATLLLRYTPKERRLDFFKKIKELAHRETHIIIVDSTFGLDDPSLKDDIEQHAAAAKLADKSSGSIPGPNGLPAFLYVLVPA